MDIERIVRDELEDDSVVRVDIQPDENRDGTPVVRVNIVLAGGSLGPDGNAMLELNEKLWNALVERGGGSIPVVKYIVEQDDHVVAAE